MAAIGTGAVLGGALINSATSGGSSAGGSINNASSMSRTYGTQATDAARQSAAQANSAAQSAWQQAASFNAAEAQKQRDWQERMANTVYQRTMNDMKAAGLNPVLAAQMGLGTASVGGGAAASMPSAMTYMPNTFPESESASQSEGSSWNHSLSGLAYLADALKSAYSAMSSTFNINVALDGIKNMLPNYDYTDADGNTHNTTENFLKEGHTLTNELLTDGLKEAGTTFEKWIKEDWNKHTQKSKSNNNQFWVR